MSATARTLGIVLFGRGMIGSIASNSSGTQFSGGGEWLRKVAGRHFSHVTGNLTGKSTTAGAVRFTASTAGANPMVPVAPDIDTFVDFTAEWLGTGVRFSGVVRGDDFPNAEVFVLDENGMGCLLFDGRTTGGQDSGPFTRLAGDHESQVLGSFSCAVPLRPDGTFTAAKNGCVVTTMGATKPKTAAWVGAGGGFSGAGATGKW